MARRGIDRVPFRIAPMLATLISEPFDRPGWVFEEKYDGIRIVAYKEGARVQLLTRNMIDRTGAFPLIAGAIARLSARTLVLDGEVVAFDRHQVSRFQLLQQGAPGSVYVAFDCVFRDGRDLRKLALADRRTELEAILRDQPRPLVLARRLSGNGLTAYAQAQRKQLEGIVAKDAASVYEECRSTRWMKVKVLQEEEFVIGGFTRPSGARTYFGALLLGAYDGSALRYVGKVGTGFTQHTLKSLFTAFGPLVTPKSPFVNSPRERGVTWLTPRLVAQVAFHEWTADQRLRQPSFLGLRSDKAPKECRLSAA